MRSEVSIGKVTVFCLRGAELLVFDHPTAGTQVPAGTINVGEAPRDAAERELAEEAGVGDIAIVANLGVIETRLARDRAYALEELEADDGRTVPRGWPLRLVGDADPQEFLHETWDYDVRPPALLDRHRGHADPATLAGSVRRHFFVAHADETPDGETWLQFADGWEWPVRWAKVDDTLMLAGEQSQWLSILRPHLDAE